MTERYYDEMNYTDEVYDPDYHKPSKKKIVDYDMLEGDIKEVIYDDLCWDDYDYNPEERN